MDSSNKCGVPKLQAFFLSGLLFAQAVVTPLNFSVSESESLMVLYKVPSAESISSMARWKAPHSNMQLPMAATVMTKNCTKVGPYRSCSVGGCTFTRTMALVRLIAFS